MQRAWGAGVSEARRHGGVGAAAQRRAQAPHPRTLVHRILNLVTWSAPLPVTSTLTLLASLARAVCRNFLMSRISRGLGRRGRARGFGSGSARRQRGQIF